MAVAWGSLGLQTDVRWGCSQLNTYWRLEEAVPKVASSDSWQIRAGCWQQASVLCEMGTSTGLPDRGNHPRESKMEVAMSRNLAFQVTLQHCPMSSWLHRSALFNIGRTKNINSRGWELLGTILGTGDHSSLSGSNDSCPHWSFPKVQETLIPL